VPPPVFEGRADLIYLSEGYASCIRYAISSSSMIGAIWATSETRIRDLPTNADAPAVVFRPSISGLSFSAAIYTWFT
jgi:hypothetical protein